MHVVASFFVWMRLVRQRGLACSYIHANKSLYFSLEKDKMTFFLLHSSLVPLFIYEFDFDWMPFLYLLRAHCWKNQIFHLFIAAIIRWKKWKISIREKCLFFCMKYLVTQMHNKHYLGITVSLLFSSKRNCFCIFSFRIYAYHFVVCLLQLPNAYLNACLWIDLL